MRNACVCLCPVISGHDMSCMVYQLHASENNVYVSLKKTNKSEIHIYIKASFFLNNASRLSDAIELNARMLYSFNIMQ